ncbi:hypothetical protein EJ05DRAFT_301027 [Pseudovirgaria hyperparasitica]|uniref:Uncharacterized protein n=1 Tax=Pseudovirgaria hyperparasitica TaxID=470096 RepID=A0A6A6W9G3_9PEZI|nr:uncharacterized protein EJ05DRAFT_301027 [Pseudovirgaria hyperparasitica]KAF2759518.1 hypothetical protein EJ05DRAFT_301027 [Pseudovirgaria hyperparasitica]
MDHLHHNHAHIHLHRRHGAEEIVPFIQPVERAEDPSPVQLDPQLKIVAGRAISEPSSASTASTSCLPNDSRPQCEKPQGSRALPIALASTIPIIVAIIVFIFLHRRNKKKVALEDMDAKHKSLDFGIDPATMPGGKKKGKKGALADLQLDEKKQRNHGNALSMDMDMSSPYLLPAGMNGSRESFHSLSRSMKDTHDPYGSVHQMSNDGPYARGLRADNMSVFTASSKSTNPLIRGASPMGRSIPQRGDSIPTPTDRTPPEIKFPEPSHQPDSAISGLPPMIDGAGPLVEEPEGRQDYFSANQQQDPSPAARDSVSTRGSRPSQSANRPPRLQSMEAAVHNTNTHSIASLSSDYGDNFKVTPPSPIVETTLELPARHSMEAITPPTEIQQPKPTGLGVEGFNGDGNKRFSMSIRPLPIDDPTENPEERANRIRSFYREYFDDSRPDPAGHYGDYYEDYGQEYLDGAIFDPDSGQFVMAGAPYAEPITRRAMTPPPRAPPRMGPKGHYSSGSTARFMPPRGQSSMSGMNSPRKPLPPPASLKSLPTPHLLKDDANLFTALDFAPPVSFRDRQAGRRPDSPLGTPRPYSPAVQPHVPLSSPFTELKAMPSPHSLRKSGTFTGLDFAPNAHLLNKPSNDSDARSVMSSRSGMSRMQLHNIRAGAYRVSRIPKEMVGTRDDIVTALKPKWDLTAPA